MKMLEILIGSGCIAMALSGGAAMAQTPAPAAPSEGLVTVRMPQAPGPVRVVLNHATTALFVSDMTDPLCKPQANCLGTMVPAVATLLAQARKAGVLVTYSTQAANQSKFLPDVAPAAGDPFFPSQGQDRFYNTDLDKTLKAKGITTVILTGWKISGSILYTSVGATLRGYTVVVPVDASLAPSDYEEAIGLYQILNQNSANPANQPLKEKATTLSRTDMITFQ